MSYPPGFDFVAYDEINDACVRENRTAEDEQEEATAEQWKLLDMVGGGHTCPRCGGEGMSASAHYCWPCSGTGGVTSEQLRGLYAESAAAAAEAAE